MLITTRTRSVAVWCSSVACHRWRRFNRNRPGSSPKRRMAVAVNDVERESDQKPPTEPDPGEMRKPLHHEHAESGADQAYNVHEGYSKRTVARWIGVAQHDDADAYERERERRPDIGQVVRLPGVSDERPHRYEYTRENRRNIGRSILSVNLACPVRQQPVARHGEEDPRLPV